MLLNKIKKETIHAIVTLLLENMLIKGENNEKAINKDNGINQINFPCKQRSKEILAAIPEPKAMIRVPGIEKSCTKPRNTVKMLVYNAEDKRIFSL